MQRERGRYGGGNEPRSSRGVVGRSASRIVRASPGHPGSPRRSVAIIGSSGQGSCRPGVRSGVAGLSVLAWKLMATHKSGSRRWRTQCDCRCVADAWMFAHHRRPCRAGRIQITTPPYYRYCSGDWSRQGTGIDSCCATCFGEATGRVFHPPEYHWDCVEGRGRVVVATNSAPGASVFQATPESLRWRDGGS